MRLIDADALIAELNDIYDGYMLSEVTCPYYFEQMIDNAPTINPVKYGWWKCHGDCGVTECSVCGWNIEEYVGDDFKYCPNCGVKMDEENS